MNDIITLFLVVGIMLLFFGILGWIGELICGVMGWDEEEKEKAARKPERHRKIYTSTVYHPGRKVSR